MENNEQGLCKAFVENVTAMLAWAADVKYELSVDEDHEYCTLHIPKVGEDGFDILVEIEPEDITVWAGDAHFHFDPDPPYVETAQSVVSLLQRMLGPEMRIRELRTWGRAYKWQLQVKMDDGWHTIQTTALWIGISLGRGSERIYQNHVLDHS